MKTIDKEIQLDTIKVYASIFQTCSAAMVITDTKFRILKINPAFTKITGFNMEELENKGIYRLFDLFIELTLEQKIVATIENDSLWRGEIEVCRKYNESFTALVLIDLIKNANYRHADYLVLFVDISEHLRLEKELRYHAEMDPLTGLANRKLFFQLLDNALALAKRFDDTVAILYLDLDGFKQVNDSLGHGHGDNVLIEVAKRLRLCVREVDTVARLGGDEFVIILNRTSKLMINDTVRRILEALTLTLNKNGVELKVTASIGIAVYPDDSADGATLLKYADAAMYKAKIKGKCRFCWHPGLSE